MDGGPSPTMTWWQRPSDPSRYFNAYAAQAGHPRLAVLVAAIGVDGGPSAAMTIRTGRLRVPTYLRFAVAPIIRGHATPGGVRRPAGQRRNRENAMSYQLA